MTILNTTGRLYLRKYIGTQRRKITFKSTIAHLNLTICQSNQTLHLIGVSYHCVLDDNFMLQVLNSEKERGLF